MNTSKQNGHNKTLGLRGILSAAAASVVHSPAPPMPAPPASPPPGGRPPWNQVVMVTPEIAERWLTANSNNRPVRKARVALYARDMRDGRWLFNTQGISFGTDSTLIDGQHRLLAVIHAGVPVSMLVWFDVPVSTRSVIDIGGTRSLRDIAKLTSHQAAVTTAMMRGFAMRSTTETMAERISFYLRHQDVIDGVIGRFPGKRHGITQASVLGAIARAALHMPTTEIENFCDVLWTGRGERGTRDETVICLRDRLLLSNAKTGGSSAQSTFYGLTAAALRAFSEGRAISKLYQPTTDPYPLPTDATSE